MKELLISQISPILSTAITAILVVIIKDIGKAVVSFINTQETKVLQDIKASGHGEDMKTAWEVWNQIEEKFRITDNLEQKLGSKADEFDKLLLQRIPGLTQQNLNDIRQAIAGEYNKGKEAVLSNSEITKQLQDNKASLEAENANLKDQLAKIQTVVTPVAAGTVQA